MPRLLRVLLETSSESGIGADAGGRSAWSVDFCCWRRHDWHFEEHRNAGYWCDPVLQEAPVFGFPDRQESTQTKSSGFLPARRVCTFNKTSVCQISGISIIRKISTVSKQDALQFPTIIWGVRVLVVCSAVDQRTIRTTINNIQIKEVPSHEND